MTHSTPSSAALVPTSDIDLPLIEADAAGPLRAENYRWVVLGFAATAQLTASFVTQGVSSIVPFWQTTYDLSRTMAALSVSAVNFGPIVSMLFMGWAIDRYGERQVVTLTMVIMGLTALAAGALAPSYVGLLLFLGLIGAWYGAVQPGGTRAIVRWFPPRIRGVAMGIRQAGLPLGGALAAVTLPGLALNLGWPSALYAQGAIGIMGGLLFGAFYRDGKLQAGAPTGPAPRMRSLVVMAVTQASLRPVLFAGIVMVSLQYTFVAHLMVFLTSQLHVPVITAGLFLAIAQGLGIAGRILLVWFSDHFWPDYRMRSLAWTMLACVPALIAFAILPAEPPLWLLALVCAWLGFFGIGWYTLFLVQVAELAPSSSVASVVSFALTLNQIAIVLAPPAFGLIADLFGGYQLGWVSLALLMIFTAFRLRSIVRISV